MKRWRTFLATCLLFLGLAAPTTAAQAAPAAAADPASLVNPLLGTSNGGNTFPGADTPFGMVSWSPDTNSRPPGGNYAYSDNVVTGFSLNHISGPGCGAMGDIPVLPTTGGIDGNATVGFSHGNETASAGAYSVNLDNGVSTELTTTARSGMARFTFPSTTQANLLFKLNADKATNLHFNKVSSTEVSGSVDAGLFCASAPSYTAYFDMVFDRPFTGTGTFDGGNSVTFDTTGNRTVQAKVGLSYVSIAGATANRQSENPAWDFGGTRTAAHHAWNDVLGKIAVTGGSSDQQQVFYTSLYHSLLHPNLLSDSDGRYWGFDKKVHTVSGGQKAQYGTYSGWDIYRTQAQLEALVAPEQASDSAQSLVNDYAQAGFFPKWSLNSAETQVMNGDPGPAIIADYYAFGARNFDTATAKADMVKEGTTTNPIRMGLDLQTKYGYLPSDGSYPRDFYGSVATLLEYSAQDFATSAFAGALGDTTTQSQFANRAQDWKNTFNASTGFMQPKQLNGSWKPGFDPTSSDQFVEGTSWQYTGAVPHNIRGLADAMGGNSKYVNYLDSVLSEFNGSGGSHADLGNEPSIELPWEYDYVGQPWEDPEDRPAGPGPAVAERPGEVGCRKRRPGHHERLVRLVRDGLLPRDPRHLRPRPGQPAVHPRGRDAGQRPAHGRQRSTGSRQRPLRPERHPQRRQLEQRLPARRLRHRRRDTRPRTGHRRQHRMGHRGVLRTALVQRRRRCQAPGAACGALGSCDVGERRQVPGRRHRVDHERQQDPDLDLQQLRRSAGHGDRGRVPSRAGQVRGGHG